MSLEQAAKHLAAHGRGPDTHLVHMSSGEIKSLQQLAKANGGSLTVNPHTGLPEAGFLDSLLPTIIGAGVTYFSGGTINPATIGMVTGGLQTLRTGSLAKGLTAGLGAYGGAGLTAGLMGAGAGAAQTLANQAIAAGPEYAGLQATSSLPGAFGEAAGSSVPTFASEGARQAALTGAQNTLASPGASLLGGVQNLSSQAGRDAFMAQMGGGKGLAKVGLAAAAPMIADQMVRTKTKAPEIKQDTSMGQRYTFSQNPVQNAQGQTPAPDVPGYNDLGRDFGREQTYFKPAYTPVSDVRAKEIYGYATGGPVEEMSTANAVGANTGYPMADISQGSYATPFQTPVSQNVVAGAQDVAVDPYTGQEQRTVPAPTARFAEGGYSYDAENQKFISNAPVQAASNSPAPNSYKRSVMASDKPLMRTALNWINPETFPMMSPEMLRTVESWKDQYFPLAQQEQESRVKFDPASQTYVDTVTGAPVTNMARGGLSSAASHLGDYSDGGRLLKGPGDGVSDSIPATIGNKRPARLADGEFVVPARIVSELGNGSTDAGARKLYAMLDRVQAARKKSIGKGKVAKNSRADKFLPA